MSFHGLIRIGEWIPGAGNADNSNVRGACDGLFEVEKRLCWRKHLTCYLWAVFVKTVKFVVAVVTLNIAFWCNGQIYLPGFVM